VFIRADPCPTETKIKSIPIYSSLVPGHFSLFTIHSSLFFSYSSLSFSHLSLVTIFQTCHYFFQSTIVNHKSSIPMRPPLHARSISQRYRCGARPLASIFLNAPFWGQNDAFKAKNDPSLRLFWHDYSVLAWPDPKGQRFH
jgi:hypothetical protein